MTVRNTVIEKKRLVGTIVISAAVVLSACTGSGAPPPQTDLTTSPGTRATATVTGTAQPGATGTAPASSPVTSTAAPNGAVGAEQLSPELRLLLERARDAYQNIDSFEGSATVTTMVEQRSVNAKVEQWFQDGRTRLELGESLGNISEGTAILSDGQSLTLLLPDRSQAFQMQGLGTYLAPLVAQWQLIPPARLLEIQESIRSIEQFAQNADARGLGQQQIAGRTAEGVEIVPADPQSPFGAQRIWFDQETGIPLRLELSDQVGQPVLQIVYDRFQPDTTVPAERFSAPSNVRVEQVTVDQLAETLQWQRATEVEVQQTAGYAVATLAQEPAGARPGALRVLDADGKTFVLQSWTTAAGQPVATLVQGPAGQLPLNLPGGEEVAFANGQAGYLFELGGSQALRWTQGQTDLLLATELSREETLAFAGRLNLPGMIGAPPAAGSPVPPLTPTVTATPTGTAVMPSGTPTMVPTPSGISTAVPTPMR